MSLVDFPSPLRTKGAVSAVRYRTHAGWLIGSIRPLIPKYAEDGSMERLVWSLKQLLPLTYRTEYGDAEGRQHFVVWNMWLGRCYRIDDVIVC